MRLVLRVAIVLSVLAVLATVGGFLEAACDINEAFGTECGSADRLAILYGLLFSLIPLALIWLGVFVAYVVAKGARVLER